MFLSSPGKRSGPPSPEKGTVETLNMSSEFSKKETLRCMFCGGDHCKRCGLDAYKSLENPAIPNLHSHWITDNILAMQRPNQRVLVECKVLEHFVSQGITAVFNLTEPGEHPYCGCGLLESSGLPYLPEVFMSVGIKYFNYAWQDMTAPSMALMMDLVNVACNEIDIGGKLAVHCHAGYGRTGIAIACILVGREQVDSVQLIRFIRGRRPGSIQTRTQQTFILSFEQHFIATRIVFPVQSVASGFVLKTISQSVRDQQYILMNREITEREYRYTIKTVVTAITAIKESLRCNAYNVCLSITGIRKLTLKSAELGFAQSEGKGNGAAMPTDSSVIRTDSQCYWSYNRSNKADITTFKSYPLSESSRKCTASYVVALSSLTETPEELYIRDIKEEINENKYLKLYAVRDILYSAFESSDDFHAHSAFNNEALNLSEQRAKVKVKAVQISSFPPPYDSEMLSEIEDDNINEPMHKNSSNGDEMKRKSSFPKIELHRQISASELSAAELGKNAASAASVLCKQTDKLMLKAPNGMIREQSSSNLSAESVDHSNSTSSSGTKSATLLTRSISGGHLTAKILRTQQSFRQFSDTDFSKSRKAANDIMAQVLFDWIETRKAAIFGPVLLGKICDLWAAYEQTSLKDRNLTDLYQRLLFEALYLCLGRFELTLLSQLVELYAEIRRYAIESTEEDIIPPIDILVGLRISVACLNGRQLSDGLVKNRALSLDLIKIFLRKYAMNEKVIINNISFADDNFHFIMNSCYDYDLIHHLEIVLKTIGVLIEHEWTYSAQASRIIFASLRASEGTLTACVFKDWVKEYFTSCAYNDQIGMQTTI